MRNIKPQQTKKKPEDLRKEEEETLQKKQRKWRKINGENEDLTKLHQKRHNGKQLQGP